MYFASLPRRLVSVKDYQTLDISLADLATDLLLFYKESGSSYYIILHFYSKCSVERR